MSAVTSPRTGERSETDPVLETPAESEQPVTTEETSAADEIVEDDAKASDGATDADEADNEEKPANARLRIHWSRVIAYGLLPGLALLLACAAGFLKWQDSSARDAGVARAESVRAATDGTVALLSYRPETVQADLEAARGRLTGTFLQAYTSLTHDVVIPGAKQKQISAVATVPAATSTSATADHAVVLLFVDQTVIVGQDAPASTASSVRVTLDKIGGRWLISQFDPV
ncbi:MAG: Mce-associated rane protein [Mycobacterium sp.]|nr:Mce-associated rane protein [Mycobacterium sp.]